DISDADAVSGGRVPVGCRLDSGELAACTVTAYVGRRRVGRGAATFSGESHGTVKVKLTGRGRRLARRLGGVKLTYRGVATTASGKRLRFTASSRVVPARATAVASGEMFASGSTKLTRGGVRHVLGIARRVVGAKRVICTGYTDSIGSAAANRRLGRARAQAICTALRWAGVRAPLTVRSAGHTHPRASNMTRRGRALNRRVKLKVTYR
ncbi:MAG TPA: OmpA family protein, partial [Solirubrobacteraceae bacterium]|nr:OmpA family protein [Solirubrobacteraceae bacterium]